MTNDLRSPYSQLLVTDRLLHDSAFSALREPHGYTRVVDPLRHILDETREAIRSTHAFPAWYEDQAQEASAQLGRESQSILRPMINLTGTVLYTDLGHASQAEEAIEAVVQAIRTPAALEYSLDDVGRGHRDRVLADLPCRLTGMGDVCIVGNNVAAVLFMLAATASGKEMVAPCGKLVEIDNAPRILDVICQAGRILREVGITSRTHAKDHRQAVNENTALLMKVHTGNYSIGGFTRSVGKAESAVIGQGLDAPVVADPGNGSLVDLSQYGLSQKSMPQ